MLAQVYAEAHQLGIDPTMKVVETLKSGKLVYDMTVRDPESREERVFRTKELINDDGTGELRGRGTRVWEVDEVVDGTVKETVEGLVLKDSWIDHDRKREGEILQEIKKSYTDSGDRQIFEAFFLTVLCHGNVYIGEEEDTTRSLMTRGATPPRYPRFDLRRGTPREASPPEDAPNTANSQDEAPCTELAIMVQLPERIIDFWPKSHYRIAFLQLCTPLSKKTSLSEVFGHLTFSVGGMCFLLSDQI